MVSKLEYVVVSPEDLYDLDKAGIGKDVLVSLIHDWARSVSRRRQSTISRSVLLLQNKFKRLRDESLDSHQVAKLLCISRRRVRQLAAPSHPGLYAFRGQHDIWQFPPCRFIDGCPRPHLRELLKAIRPDAHPASVDRFMRTEIADLEDPELGHPLSPRVWLVVGYDAEPVLDLARTL